MKKCIYHYPRPIVDNPSVGSEVRPYQMLKAFKEIGYEVEEVTGFSKERARIIKKIQKNIKNGEKYDFVYSESTTMPTALTDENHLPVRPFMDEAFLSSCKKNGIPVGLFYRDAHWKFPLYREGVRWWIPFITIPFYKHELRSYKRITDCLFVPSKEFANAIGYKGKYVELPSGGNPILTDNELERKDDRIGIFYVGGINGLNDITLPAKVISEFPDYRLTICCSVQEWNTNEALKEVAENSSNISVIHKNKQDLDPYYIDVDLTMALFERNAYRDLAMPVKLFESIGCGKPIIATYGTAAGRYVIENDIGWSIEYEMGSFRKLLSQLSADREEICQKTKNTKNIIQDNTWLARAQMVVEILTDKHAIISGHQISK